MTRQNINLANDHSLTDLKANLHYIVACNCRCRGCFATEFPCQERVMSMECMKLTVVNLISAGVTHFNLAGGEPTLHPHFFEIVKFIYDCGAKVSVISNGSKITASLLEEVGPYLDTLGLSIDSFNHNTSLELGRFTGSSKKPKFFGYEEVLSILPIIRKYGIRLKVNTVISNINCNEIMADKISSLAVNRWKIIKMSPYAVGAQNNFDMVPSNEEYINFIKANDYKNAVIESDMKNAYLVVDPSGNLLDNSLTGDSKNGQYSVIGNFTMETASDILSRFFRIFNIEAFRQRYAS